MTDLLLISRKQKRDYFAGEYPARGRAEIMPKKKN